MRTRYMLTIPVFAIAAALIAPALAESPGGSRDMPSQGMGMDRMGHGMMSSGCPMMQSMNDGVGPPNSQWRKRPHGNAMPN